MLRVVSNGDNPSFFRPGGHQDLAWKEKRHFDCRICRVFNIFSVTFYRENLDFLALPTIFEPLSKTGI